MMYIPKKYGQSRVDRCPFCDKQATALNKQGVPVCVNHKKAIMNDMKCICGERLDIMTGKYGIFFNCIKCGNKNMKKVLENNEVRDISEDKPAEDQGNEPVKTDKAKPGQAEKFISYNKQNEEVVRSDDPRYFE